jgi:hypothetical protein
MIELLAFPLLALVVLFQTAVISRISLLGGHADLMLVVLAAWALQERVKTAWHWAALGGLMIGIVSGLPWVIPLIGYFAVVGMAHFLQGRIWQMPLLAMLGVTFLGTIFMHLLTIFTLRLQGVPLSIADALGVVTLPSLFLNFFFAVFVYALMRDFAAWMYPMEHES